MIAAQALTKMYGEKVAVDNLDFTVEPGMVTGFLGPNGAGKSTTMRMIIGLDRPTSGSVTVNGRTYRDHPAPLHEVGALLEAKAVHGSRTGFDHLLALGATHGIGKRRVAEVLDLAGLTDVAHRPVKGFSLGMGQRLGIASALLGDPGVVMLDEPVNGLDPEGVRWVRELLRSLAAQGRTVFLSSHLMAEMALTADRVVVVGRGRLIRSTTMADLIASASTNVVHVRTPEASALRDLLVGPDTTVSSDQRGVLDVTGLTAERIGAIALENRILLVELTPKQASLEEIFMDMTHDAVEYHSAAPALTATAAPTRSQS